MQQSVNRIDFEVISVKKRLLKHVKKYLTRLKLPL